jgi:cell wall-associated NlpC family hydrolase
MRPTAKCSILALILYGLGLAPWFASAQTENDGSNAIAAHNTSRHQDLATSRSLTTDDGLSVIASALDSRVRLHSGNDCSHLVHTIYERAGFPYFYVSSSSLYAGTKEFQRVKQPQPGDLVVWRGHVGIVVNPARHEFFSTLSSGPGIDTYDAPYWKQRGRLRFYRYVKTGTSPVASHRLVLAHQNK